MPYLIDCLRSQKVACQPGKEMFKISKNMCKTLEYGCASRLLSLNMNHPDVRKYEQSLLKSLIIMLS